MWWVLFAFFHPFPILVPCSCGYRDKPRRAWVTHPGSDANREIETILEDRLSAGRLSLSRLVLAVAGAERCPYFCATKAKRDRRR
jgi:hypothetical protein